MHASPLQFVARRWCWRGVLRWVCSFGFGGGIEVGWRRQDLCIVVSIRPGWARNYFTYFFVYSARHFVPARGLGQSRGHQWGEAVYSQVFERRLPPGPVAILVLTGLAVDALVLPLLIGGVNKRTFCLGWILDYMFPYELSRGGLGGFCRGGATVQT